MSKYFDPIDINAERGIQKPEPVVNPDIVPDVTLALEFISQIIADLEGGISPLRKGAIYFPSGKSCPVKESLARLRQFPTSKKAIREFITAAQGDLGTRVAKAMADHLIFADKQLGEVFDEPKTR